MIFWNNKQVNERSDNTEDRARIYLNSTVHESVQVKSCKEGRGVNDGPFHQLVAWSRLPRWSSTRMQATISPNASQVIGSRVIPSPGRLMVFCSSRTSAKALALACSGSAPCRSP